LAFSCYFECIFIALRSIFAGDVRNGLKLLIASVGYWRFYPNALVMRLARELRPASILDLSSPKLVSLILAREFDVLAVDLDDPQLETRWAKAARLLGLSRYRHAYEDATRLSMPEASFDFVYSLSVVEHIPGDGDREAMEEIARVLKPGGQALVEVPLRHRYAEIFQRYDSKGFALPEPRFYERHYSPETLNRLDTPRLEVLSRWSMGEYLPIDPWIATPRLPRLLRLLILPLEPWLAAVNIWLNGAPGKDRPLSMILHVRKPAL
jgi:SAM-dependent methyltransferase